MEVVAKLSSLHCSNLMQLIRKFTKAILIVAQKAEMSNFFYILRIDLGQPVKKWVFFIITQNQKSIKNFEILSKKRKSLNVL